MDFAGGYCTVACAATGTTSGCPEGSICDAVSGAGPTCVRVCKTSSDWRTGLDCNGVSGKQRQGSQAEMTPVRR